LMAVKFREKKRKKELGKGWGKNVSSNAKRSKQKEYSEKKRSAFNPKKSRNVEKGPALLARREKNKKGPPRQRRKKKKLVTGDGKKKPFSLLLGGNLGSFRGCPGLGEGGGEK